MFFSGRLAWELIQKGFSVMGNEYSMFMLMASCFVLNACKEVNFNSVERSHS